MTKRERNVFTATLTEAILMYCAGEGIKAEENYARSQAVRVVMGDRGGEIHDVTNHVLSILRDGIAEYDKS